MKINVKNAFGVLCCVVVLWSCGSNAEKVTLEGNIKNMPGQTIALEELGFTEAKLLDTIHSDATGHFVMHTNYNKEPGLYRLKLGDQFILLVIDNDKININGAWDKFEKISIKGSPASSSLQQFIGGFNEKSKSLFALKIALDSLSNNGTHDSLLIAVNSDIERATTEVKNFLKQYADTTAYLPNAIFAASKLMSDETEGDYLKSFVAKMDERFGTSNPLGNDFKTKAKERVALQEKSTSTLIGSTAPDFTLKNLKGEPVDLKSLRGSYVLIDFWASWCMPCRAENPNVVKAYEKYKQNNFTIIGVSLDKDKDKWAEAVAKDKLSWVQVSDLQGWESTVAGLYGVQSIPANFLLDPSGKIIAANLRGAMLEKKLAEVLTNGNAKP
jgi:peroxiredoxin